jgi:hypothetical protein
MAGALQADVQVSLVCDSVRERPVTSVDGRV